MDKIIENFMTIYMYELETFLLDNLDEIKELKFQSDEANTDRPLKEYLKFKIESQFNTIPKNSKIFLEEMDFPLEKLKEIYISSVLLQEDISSDIKELLQSEDKNFTKPDICLVLNIDDKIFYKTIEVKSTKNDKIPGSSVRQVNPEEWVIFVKHSSKCDIVTGKYVNSLSSKIQFPDRSPRPEISFKLLKEWNTSYRNLDSDNKLIYSEDSQIETRLSLLTDWQYFLSEKWMEILFKNTTIKSKEPWFNTNLRKFILLFIEKYDTLSEKEKNEFIEKTKKMITK